MAGGLHVPQLLTEFMTHSRSPRDTATCARPGSGRRSRSRRRRSSPRKAAALLRRIRRRPRFRNRPPSATTGQRARSIDRARRNARIRPTTAGSWRSSPHENLGADRGFSDAPDLTPEELQRRGDAADALWRELGRATAAHGGEAPSRRHWMSVSSVRLEGRISRLSRCCGGSRSGVQGEELHGMLRGGGAPRRSVQCDKMGRGVCDAETSTDLADTADGSRCRPTNQRANTPMTQAVAAIKLRPNWQRIEIAEEKPTSYRLHALQAVGTADSPVVSRARQLPTRRKSRARCSTN